VAIIHELLPVFVTSRAFTVSLFSKDEEAFTQYIRATLHSYSLRNKKWWGEKERKKNQMKENEKKDERKKDIKRDERKRHVTSAKHLAATCDWNVFLLNSSVI
jgi:hypothetical protein